MASRSRLVNLDAMILRADFAVADSEVPSSYDAVATISLRDFAPGSLLPSSLRKPDFQRETNHWTPDQVVSLLECFVNGDLIPSVILWRSPTYLFVIDGGHRLSVLRAWVEDDYGDGPLSTAFFGHQISDEQRRSAKQTRELVKTRIGTWQHFQRMDRTSVTETELRKINTIVSRGLPVQWVQGNAEKAEGSFFKINTKGTPLDSIEELLLANRKRPVAIAARAVIRAGMGHKYWSSFSHENVVEIETLAQRLHTTLFEPELNAPIKTLDLPLGGSTGVRTALQVLIEFIVTANKNQSGEPSALDTTPEDDDGSSTIKVLKKAVNLATRFTGNDKGSLGLHPAIYFYGPTGRHVGPLFMGTATLLARKIVNNDSLFFYKFTAVRASLEALLISHKDLLATILQRTISRYRTSQYADLLDKVINALNEGLTVSDADLVSYAGLVGKIIVGSEMAGGAGFSDDSKSAAFLRSSLASAMKCPICQGYLDPQKSVSYDHIVRLQDGGAGHVGNCQLTHPFCNQAVKH
ncbi:DUF262 domain-containing protein [Caballeronia sp. Sq4a]|uniref:GmrSD restriction endonuclease domain-containing protein n=1 Tax=Caballeronia sp. Sq4a TaxID=2878152 RepID=UPI0020BFB331|nr:DUF262 domain-containing protein [Caballeronia sp. Sq4a]